MTSQPAPTPPADAAAARRKAMLQPVYRFSVSWRAPDGTMYAGQFAHRAPTIADQMAVDQAVGVATAAAGGHLGEDAQRLAAMVAHLQRTLAERPHWAEDLGALPHVNLLVAVAREAMAHASTFCEFGGGEGAGGGLGGGPPDAAAPLVVPTL